MWVISRVGPALLRQEGPFSPKEIAEGTGLEGKQVSSLLNRLRNKGIVESLGEGQWQVVEGAKERWKHSLDFPKESAEEKELALRCRILIHGAMQHATHLVEDKARFPMLEKTRKNLVKALRKAPFDMMGHRS